MHWRQSRRAAKPRRASAPCRSSTSPGTTWARTSPPCWWDTRICGFYMWPITSFCLFLQGIGYSVRFQAGDTAKWLYHHALTHFHHTPGITILWLNHQTKRIKNILMPVSVNSPGISLHFYPHYKFQELWIYMNIHEYASYRMARLFPAISNNRNITDFSSLFSYMTVISISASWFYSFTLQ